MGPARTAVAPHRELLDTSFRGLAGMSALPPIAAEDNELTMRSAKSDGPCLVRTGQNS